MFAFLVPETPARALDLLRTTRLRNAGPLIAAPDPTNGGGAVLYREGWDFAKTDHSKKRTTKEGWTYFGHSLPLSAFRRPRMPEAVEVVSVCGQKLMIPLAEKAPSAIDFCTNSYGGPADDWAIEAFRLFDTRESYKNEDGQECFRLKGTDAELFGGIFRFLCATHFLTEEVLSDTKAVTTQDIAAVYLAVWGYSVGKPKPAGGGG